IVFLLIFIYCTTSLFRNMIMRSGNDYIIKAIAVISPVVTILMLILCTALISYTGSSEFYLTGLQERSFFL
ncbi:MAG: hypothetical protein K2J36_01720, partial [Ruminococcus sp.]|nr:hypothetical protein [Ruminococcus sp.]